MIIDGHAHACGDFLRAENIVEILDRNQVDKVVLVPGELIGHLFRLEEYIQTELRMDNIYFDISTPPLISIVRLQKALDSFGAQRLILGSDTPYGAESLRKNIERVKALTLSEEKKSMILGGNLQRILCLDSA